MHPEHRHTHIINIHCVSFDFCGRGERTDRTSLFVRPDRNNPRTAKTGITEENKSNAIVNAD